MKRKSTITSVKGFRVNTKSRNITLKFLKASYVTSTISCVSIIFAIISFQQQSINTSINSQYLQFLELTKLPLTEPEIAHLIALPDKYYAIKRLVSNSTKNNSEPEQSRLLIKERFIANYIFTLFEQKLYDHSRVSSAFFLSREKKEFSQAVLDYFTGRVLRNPRLLWYWSQQGGGLSTHYEAETKKYYEFNVTNDKNNPLEEKMDPNSPYGPKLTQHP